MTAVDAKTDYEAVIGLEVHTELATATKLFCGCANEFGAEPNTHVCPVCLGLPGSLPVLNERAVEFALRFAEAVHLHVPEQSIFARKNYFYPDMPKDYQVSQYEEPITIDGWVDVDGTRIGLERAHLEEDTGKTVHVGGGGRIHDAAYSLVDYNRAGVPLMEIVSRPDIRSAEQARAYVAELRAVLQAIGVSDVKMEEGSMRVDANVSVRPVGAPEFGTKVEVKNMNSLRSLGRAIDFEIERQIAAIESGERIVQETRHWDEDDARTHSMRTKEGSSDYRYFPEPDLVPVAPTAEMRASVVASMPELPAARRARLVSDWGIPDADARVLVNAPGLADYAEAAVLALAAGRPAEASGTPKEVANWCIGSVLAYLNETSLSPEVLPLAPDGLAELVGLVAGGTLSRNQAKDVLDECLREPKRPKQVVEERGLAQVSDEGALAAVVDDVLAAHPTEVDEYRAGDDKVRKKKQGFFMGEAMRATENQANPQLLRRLLEERLEG
jgi:aspartyl-tRNA(Asn)/glutamyl-tRNA(Gln) amidotransferase subunit B